MRQLINNVLTDQNILLAQNFLIKCGKTSFFLGFSFLSVNALFDAKIVEISNDNTTYDLPRHLKLVKPFITVFDSLWKIIYVSSLYGLIGLTWPVSVPLIRYMYKKDIKNDKQ